MIRTILLATAAAAVVAAPAGAATKKAASLGGTVMKDVTPVPNFGEFSVITDPTGAHFALWQPKNK